MAPGGGLACGRATRTNPFMLPTFDILRHVLVVGKTGTGKSTLLRKLASREVQDNSGLVLIDPHGDLAAEVQATIPRRRRNDLVSFVGADPDHCPGLNPLRAVAPERRSLVVSALLATMRKIWPEFWGPRTEHILRNVLLALLEVRGATLLDAPKMLVDEAHQRWVLKQVRDELVQQFWMVEFPAYGKKLSAEAAAPVLNKLGALLSPPVVRAVLTRRRPLLDARKHLDRSRILIASLPKGMIGEDAAMLLGGLILGEIQHAALARADASTATRRRCAVVVDEATSFATRPFVELAAEMRKFGVGLVLATQSLAALDRDVRAALLGNVGTLISFQVGAEDAEIVSREFCDKYPPPVLMRLGIGESAWRVGSGTPFLVPAQASSSSESL